MENYAESRSKLVGFASEERNHELPGCDDEDNTQRGAFNEPSKSRFVCVFKGDVCERGVRNRYHVFRTFKKSANFSCSL